jgi:hypothetical protein
MMKQPLTFLALTTLAFVGSVQRLAAQDPLLQDLKVTIALQGYPCDEIVSAERSADSDYTAGCRDGNRYRVFVNAQGRVIVEKL